MLERAYGFSRDRIATTLEELVATESLVVEEADDVARAAFRYRTAGAGFSDLMVLAAAERSGAYPLVTFDRKAARLEGVSLLLGRTGREVNRQALSGSIRVYRGVNSDSMLSILNANP